MPNYSFDTYATDDVITKPEVRIAGCKQLFGLTALCYFEALCAKSLWCVIVYNTIRTDGFYKGVHPSIFRVILMYSGAQKDNSLQSLVRIAALLVNYKNL